MNSALLSFLAPIAVTAGAALAALLITKAFKTLTAYLRSKPKLQALAPAAEIGEEAADAALNAAKADIGRPPLVLLKDAGKAAEGVVVANKQALLSTAEAEVEALLQEGAPQSATTPAGGTVNLPKGFATQGALGVLAALTALVVLGACTTTNGVKTLNVTETVAIVAAVAAGGTLAALIATHGQSQALQCVEGAASPALLADLGEILSGQDQGAVSANLDALLVTDTENVAKCALLDIAQDKLGLDAGTIKGDLEILKARAVTYLVNKGLLKAPSGADPEPADPAADAG